MNLEWLQQLEKDLDQRLEDFLQFNPYQDFLFREQQKKARVNRLKISRDELETEAAERRKELVALAGLISEWKKRVERAKNAGAVDLAMRAENYVNQIMDQGRQLWLDLDELGLRFKEIEEKMSLMSEVTRCSNSDIEDDWSRFEDLQELEKIKQNKTF